jgi:hypothetical protein
MGKQLAWRPIEIRFIQLGKMISMKINEPVFQGLLP